ncbi:MAG: glycosyltransferase involved in cell wall biosynthesis [Marivirga sp.]|jgi:glycosyltransferase involved in cell wall biosynthesis
MRIGFDAKRAFNNFTGLGNYTRFIINALANIGENDLLLYTPQISNHPEANAFERKFKNQIIVPRGLYSKGVFKSIWRSTKIYHDAENQKANIFHGLSNELPSGKSPKVKRVVTIHDLIFLRYPHFYPFVDRHIYRRKFKNACETADSVVAVSEQTKRDIIEFLNIPEEKITVIYQGVHHNYNIDISTNRMMYLTEQYGLHNPYLVYVGSIEERKNAVQMVKAFALMKQQAKDNTELIIIGKQTAYQAAVEQEIKKSGLLSEVKILNNVPFSDLPFLYKGAVATVYPSSFEGFGIPVLESLTMGTPVITGMGSALAEAGGKHALYVDPQNSNDFSLKMAKMINDQDFVKQQMTGVAEHLNNFTSAHIGHQLLAHYKSLL